jgi:catechol 2,3-dioxygenase-like lactoylglutathione lyase family enzyme
VTARSPRAPRDDGSVLSVERSNVILYCERWSETVAFYRQILGEAVTADRGWFVEFAVGDGSYLSVADAGRASIAPSYGAGLTLSWQVPDVESARDTLVTAGIVVSGVHRRFGSPVVDLHDPEGHRIELWSLT